MMSASFSGRSVLTWPAGAASPPGCRPCTRKAASTLRSVTGSSAGVCGPSARRSTMPNGAAANLASGGMPPVATLKGKLSALDRARPAASFKPLGNSSWNSVLSARGAANCTLLTKPSAAWPSSSPPVWGLIDSRGDFRRIAAASLRGTGALKDSVIGRIGRQAAWAFSRSQVNSAKNGARTSKVKRFSTLPATPLGVTTPLPHTSCTRDEGVSRRLHASVTMDSGSRAACLSRPWAWSSAARSLPSIRRTGTRSPTPSAAHHTFACTLASCAGPLSCSTKNCSSSMCS